MTTIKITELTNIGANLNGNTLVPVVNMNGTPVTQRSNVENLANYVLNTGTGANLGAVGNITITGGTDGYVLQTDGTGNLSWVAQSGGGNGTPGGANTQIQFNDAGSFGGDSGLTFNKTTNDLTVAGNIISTDGNVTANWVIGDYVSGNATPLHHIPGANVTGAVSFATTANAVAAANVSGLGNIATVNLDGNSSNILYGNGVFDSIPNPFNQDLNTTDNVTFANITSTDAIRFSNSSNIVGALGYAPTYVSIEGYGSNAVNITANDVYTWSFGDTGNLTLPGNTFSVNYANGVQVSIGGGGNASALVNGDNSFVLDSAGNVVFEGVGAGQAVDRGLVWDYGANANGVNSMIRQDLNGLTVRAWTENAGNYTAPVNIVTGQDAATNTWRFDGQGNLTVPSGSINSISDAGDLGAYITLTPDIGLARLTGREAQSSVNYTNTAWTSATYTGTQIDFVDSPQLVDFFNTNRFNVGVNQTISINGDEPIPFTGYTSSVGNAVIVYTSVTADPDPTTVTSIDFYYQLESYIAVDYDDGTLNVNATGLTINIDNDQTSGPDINIRSGDDILLQAKDKALGSESEGGDINIYAGDGADDDGLGNTSSTGGDIQIIAGIGGDGNSSTGSGGGFTVISGGTGGGAGVTSTAGSGGYVSINGGDGGYDNGNTQLGGGGGYVSISAGLSTQEGVDGPNVTITSGQGGPNALAGSVVISTPASVDGPGGNWVFDGNGVLSIPGSTFTSTSLNTIKGDNGFRFRPSNNSETAGPELYVTYNDGIQIMPLTFDYYTPGNAAAPLIIAGASTNVAGMAPGTISIHGGHNSTDATRGNVSISVGSNSWVFGNTGVMTLPGGAIVDSSSDNFEVRAIENVNFEANAVVNIYTDGSNNAYQWQFDDNGKLNLAGGGSIIESIANSSLDPTLPNVSTMVFTPDSTYSSQSLVLDPTSPGHIHLRAYAFSNIDEPAANIFLGGENTSFEVTNGANNEARIHSAGNTWTFGNDSTTTVPGHINAITNNSITLNAYDNGAGPTVQMINWNSGSETPTTIISSEVTEAVITTNVNATPYSWTFDNAGNLTLPGNLIATTASPHMTINGFSFSNSTDYSGSGNISAGGNLTITGTITSTGKMGYSVGGNATQTSTGQGVTINQLTGLVTLANRTYNAGDLEAFSISCNKVSNDDFVLVQMVDSVNAPSYNVVAYPNFVLANTISVLVKTLETVGTDTPILKFMIVKAPIA